MIIFRMPCAPALKELEAEIAKEQQGEKVQ